MPKKVHSKFVVSADPYPAIDMTNSNIIYHSPPGENNKQPEYDGDKELEVFSDSIFNSDDPDISLNKTELSYPLTTHVESDFPDFFEYPTSANVDHDYGIQADQQPHYISIDKLFDLDSYNGYNAEISNDDDASSIQGLPYSELLEDEWEIGLKRKEHDPEFQSVAGLDFGDEFEGNVDDDEGDAWTNEE